MRIVENATIANFLLSCCGVAEKNLVSEVSQEILRALENERNMAQSILGLAKQIAAKSIDKLVRAQSRYHLNEAKPLFERAISIAARIEAYGVSELSNNSLAELHSAINSVSNRFNQIDGFDAENLSEPGREYSSIVSSLYQEVSRFEDLAKRNIPVLLFSADSEAKKLELLLAEQKKAVESTIKVQQVANSEIESAKSQLAELIEEVRTARDQARSLAAEAGMVREAIWFKKQCEEHRFFARCWMVVIVIIVFAQAFVLKRAYDHFDALSNDSPIRKIVQASITEIAALSLLSFALVWSSRTFRAHQHNYIVNRHRQNALSTFREFASSAKTPDTKDAVLLAATKCVFSPQPTGYMLKDGAPIAVPLLEILNGGK